MTTQQGFVASFQGAVLQIVIEGELTQVSSCKNDKKTFICENGIVTITKGQKASPPAQEVVNLLDGVFAVPDFGSATATGIGKGTKKSPLTIDSSDESSTGSNKLPIAISKGASMTAHAVSGKTSCTGASPAPTSHGASKSITKLKKEPSTGSIKGNQAGKSSSGVQRGKRLPKRSEKAKALDDA